ERIRERAEADGPLVREPRERECLERRERAGLGVAARAPLLHERGHEPFDCFRDSPRGGWTFGHPGPTASAAWCLLRRTGVTNTATTVATAAATADRRNALVYAASV